MKLLKSMAAMVLGMATMAWAAAPAAPPAVDNAPAIPAAAPMGRIIIAGADAAKPGEPMTYQISYVADDACVGKALAMALKTTFKVEKEVKDAKTGNMVKKQVDQNAFKYIPFTPKKQAVELVNLPEFTNETQFELFVTEADGKTEPLSNSFVLRKSGNTFALLEAGEVAKVAAALPEKATAQFFQPRKVLVYTAATGFYHDAIPLGARVVRMIGDKTRAWQTVVSNDKYMFEPETLNQFDAVYMDSTTGSMFGFKDKATNEAIRKNFVEYVTGGKGLAGCHAATDCSYDWKEYGELIGGFFSGHPYGNIMVKNDDPQSPINAAFKGEGFKFSDEMYVFGPRGRDGKDQPYSREKLHVLLSIDVPNSKLDPKAGKRDDEDYAISWIHEAGKGHVFYCSFGHGHQPWWTPTILQHISDGVQYALGDLKADATPSKK